MKALLDTRIIVQKEVSKTANQDIDILYKWLDKANYTKCVHPITIQGIERFTPELSYYERLNNLTPIQYFTKQDSVKRDLEYILLFSQLMSGEVDILISDDQNIHAKVAKLGLSDYVFNSRTIIERHARPIEQKYFRDINLYDDFFHSFKNDYVNFENWFNKKANEVVNVIINQNRILSFLFLKIETEQEDYSDIFPIFSPKKRLKIGTFKMTSTGIPQSERFRQIIFDAALNNSVQEIYVTIFSKREGLINTLISWGFKLWGKKGDEQVYTFNF